MHICMMHIYIYIYRRNMHVCMMHIYIYYMDSGILLGTKTLVELIRHYIRDTVRVFSVCHA